MLNDVYRSHHINTLRLLGYPLGRGLDHGPGTVRTQFARKLVVEAEREPVFFPNRLEQSHFAPAAKLKQ